MTSVKPKKQYRRYTNRDRKCLLAHFHASPLQDEAKFCADMQIARSTWRGWRNNEHAILHSKRHGSKGSLGGQGRKTIIPFKDALLAYIDERRDEEKFVRVFHMMRWIRRNKHEWLTTYLSTKKNASTGYDSLCCLLRRFCTRERLSQRVPCVNKVRQEVLDDVWLGYAAHFWDKYHDVPCSQILNADETGVFFDMPPGKTYARKGKSSKVGKSCKHSERITVVLTIRADGKLY
ncbi:hypothetical protein DYB25_003444 [Aphanomyces astaci]|uniref:DDE-1 domain-containing protein n=1 Tax=Aphanomyces astaci TaxID=112090 RepID=A0A396ZYQ6_APHAT|nr:hypothetical protein DYB36_013117 [Aphanomyces astaci]RHY20426.1 hypothetical protein DYB25_003444 [Aphanomyces astaci]RHY52809.1 hypothetical protein DYB30_011090 [Aphanomyces astaci]RHZ10211.1 hypothetical protein DYB31_003040 [Aphanomyces astaci]